MAFRLPTGTTNKPTGTQAGYRGQGTSAGQSGQWNVDTFGKSWFQPDAPKPTFGAPNVGTGGSAPALKPMSAYKPDMKPASSYTQPPTNTITVGGTSGTPKAQAAPTSPIDTGGRVMPTPPTLAPTSPFGGEGGGTGSAAMQGLGAALEGIEDPMSALSMPAGLREGLGRRQYPTLANALAGLRY